jgi:hypothetical protein
LAPSDIAPFRQAPTLFLDELDHLPIRDEIPLRVGRIREEAAGYRQPARIGTALCSSTPGPVDPVSGDQTYREPDL